MTETAILVAIASVVAGFALGLAFFTLLGANVRLYTQGNRGLGIALHVVRLGVIAAAFFVLARFGALALIAGLSGFVFARFVAVRRRKETP